VDNTSQTRVRLIEYSNTRNIDWEWFNVFGEKIVFSAPLLPLFDECDNQLSQVEEDI